jgi:hypothetical protein
MKLFSGKRRSRYVGLLIVAAGVFSIAGCPVDSDNLLTDVTRAALESATSSIVEALSAYLAGN